MTAPLQLTVLSDDLTPAQRADITRELDDWITRTTSGVRTSAPASGPPREGDKGLELAVGSLLLAVINAGAATALVNCLATYIKERRRTLKLEVRDAAGRTVSFAAENLGSNEIDGLVRQMKDLAQVPEVAAR